MKLTDDEIMTIMWHNNVDSIGRPSGALTGAEIDGCLYTIIPKHSIDERWDGEKLSNTQFAVFSGTVQYSRWYNNYGSCVRKMISLGRKHTIPEEVAK